MSVLTPSTAQPPDPSKFLNEAGDYTVPGGSACGALLVELFPAIFSGSSSLSVGMRAMSMRSAHCMTVERLGFYALSTPGSGSCFLSLYDADENIVSSTDAFLPSSEGFQDYALTTPVLMNAGETWWVALKGPMGTLAFGALNAINRSDICRSITSSPANPPPATLGAGTPSGQLPFLYLTGVLA